MLTQMKKYRSQTKVQCCPSNPSCTKGGCHKFVMLPFCYDAEYIVTQKKKINFFSFESLPGGVLKEGNHYNHITSK